MQPHSLSLSLRPSDRRGCCGWSQLVTVSSDSCICVWTVPAELAAAMRSRIPTRLPASPATVLPQPAAELVPVPVPVPVPVHTEVEAVEAAAGVAAVEVDGSPALHGGKVSPRTRDNTP
jgi:hypothetical protein